MTQQRQSGGLFDFEGSEQFELLLRGFAEAGEVLLTDLDAMFLQPTQELQRGFRTVRAAVGFEAHAHDPVQHQREKTDQRMGTDAIR